MPNNYLKVNETNLYKPFLHAFDALEPPLILTLVLKYLPGPNKT